MHASNLNSEEVETGGSEFQDQFQSTFDASPVVQENKS